MKLSPETIEVLRNFASINQGINITAGSEVKTKSVKTTIVAFANVKEEFPQDFSIYDLNELLSVISMFKEPEISFKEDFMTISHGRTRVRYFFAAPGLVTSPDGKGLGKFEPLAEFDITKAVLDQILKAASIMSLGRLVVSGDSMLLANTNDGNTMKVDIDFTKSSEKNETWAINVENMKFLPGDYKVTVTKAFFKFENDRVTYYCPLEA